MLSRALIVVALASGVLAPPVADARGPAVAASFAPPASGVSPPLDTGNDPSPVTRGSGQDLPDPPGDPHLTHAIYFVPKNKPDQALDAVGGPLRVALDGTLAWFNARMGRRPRMDRVSAGGAYDITFVWGERDAGAYTGIGAIAEELTRRGFAQLLKRYIVFAAIGRGSVCGEAFYPLPGGIEEGNYSVVYLDSAATCGARDWGNGTAAGAGKNTTITAHEWVHNDGVVPLGAPHQCLPLVWHVCTGPLAYVPSADPEEPDLMFPFITHPASQKVLDRDNDDYLDHNGPWPDLRDSAWLEG